MSSACGVSSKEDRGINSTVPARAYKCANRFVEAKAVGQQAVQKRKDFASLRAVLFETAFAEHEQSVAV